MTTVGEYIGLRLAELKISSYFAIPGDYNLTLLDELLKNTDLQMINCCNELNAGYAADGFARVHGIGALVITFGVGSLSAINAVAGAYSENIPLIVIAGGPNTNSIQDTEILHHTLATENNDYVRQMFDRVTVHTVYIHKPRDAPIQIDEAFAMALEMKKPVYIEIACNIANAEVSAPTPRSFSPHFYSDPSALKEALDNASAALNAAIKPVLVTGSRVRPYQVGPLIEQMSQSCGYALASMPDAKSFVSETHPNYIGIYWGPVSSPGCSAIVESSDLYVFLGPNFNDYTTVGHVCNINPNKAIILDHNKLSVCGKVYTGIQMQDFLEKLIPLLRYNDAAITAFKRIAGSAPLYDPPANLQAPITTRYLFGHIQSLLSSDYAVLAETGDSWFNGLRLRLPEGCPFEIQMQYGSIGWSVGALLGMQAALHQKKRVIALIGDGSFQMGAQELSTLIRYHYHPIIFLLNNASYGIEVQIHDGPYNVINNWQYKDLVTVFNGDNYSARGYRVTTYQELIDIMPIIASESCLSLVEVILDKNDCNKNLLDWGARVATYNSRPPKG